MKQNRVFISYASKDRQWAEWLEERLRRIGFDIWTDATSVPVGESWIAELSKTIKKSDILLAVLSPNYFQSTWCQRETEIAAVNKIPVIPVMVERCEVQGILQYYQYADLTSDRESGFRAVVAAAEHMLAQPAA